MIKVLTSDQLHAADQYTMDHEPVLSIDLMERAAHSLQFSITEEIKISPHSAFYIFCGYGNNGGDGLALGRLLYPDAESVNIFCLADKKQHTPDFNTNFERLIKIPMVNHFLIKNENDFPAIPENAVIIDAIFGSGLNKPLSGLPKKLVKFLNEQKSKRIAIDIPSGLFADHFTADISFHADHTITFHSPKFSFLFADNYESIGDVHTADIGLNKEFIASLPVKNFLLEEHDIRVRLQSRKKFDHKGKFGHAFIHAGNIGKMGAAIMCARACARTGAGLTTAHIPQNQSSLLNIAVPEVMTEEYSNSHALDLDLSKFSSFAFGPGIGTHDHQRGTFFSLLKKISACAVFDADALNLLSEEKNWWKLIPENSILTPHPKEFERLAGKTSNWEERHNHQLKLSTEHSLFIILKGALTCITTPEGYSFFNPTGNPAMAKGGSGDVLTGMIVSLLAQHYSPQDACIISVYLHGLAADLAVEYESAESLLASDIIDRIGDAFRKIENPDDPFPDPPGGFDYEEDDQERDILGLN